jgi:(heptosyl)LPS beta-1,4-glucosyltransferase
VLSVVLTVWNEEANILRVLESVRGLADEIVVVDTESQDKTVAIAKKFGCKVYHHKYTGIVEPVRNFSISKATGDWILLLDGDEEVSYGLAQVIRDAIADPGVDYYRIPRKNIIFGSWIKSDHWWPDYVYRLFKKGFIVWPDAIHGIPETRGVGKEFPKEEKYALTHHNYQTVSQYLERLDRYSNSQLRLLVDRQVPFTWTLLMTKPTAEFLTQYFARNGYKEGIHGLVLAGLQAFSELVLYVKYWQYLGSKSEEIKPPAFNRIIRKQLRDLEWWIYEKKISKAPFFIKPLLKIMRQISVFLSGHL